MESSLNIKTRQVLKGQQEEMEFNSKEVEPPMNFYLSSLEEQVRCELLDNKARITPTRSEGRVLLEVDEDCLQQFLDVLHENKTTKSTEWKMEISKNVCQEKAPSKAFCQVQMDKQKAETNKIAAALKETQELLESERLKLKNGHQQWHEEKASLVDQNKRARNLYQKQGKIIADFDRIQKEAKQTLQRFQAAHEGQLEEQRAETNKIAAALKETQELLEHERQVQPKTITKAEMEVFKNLCHARIVELVDVNSKLKAALLRADQELKNGHRQWQEEKSSFVDQNKKACELYHTQVKIIADFGRTQRNDKQTLQKVLAAHKGQLEEQRAETSKIMAALKDTEDLLAAERLRFQEQSSITAHLEKTCTDLENAQLKNVATHRTLEEKATQMSINDQRSQAKLEKQRAEIGNILGVLKKTEDLLEAEHLRFQEQSSLMEHLESTCRDLEHAQLMNVATHQTLEEEAAQMFKRDQESQAQLEEQRLETNRIKAARKTTEDLLETERLLWQQEKSSLLQATEKDLQSQDTIKEKKKKRFKLFKKS